MKFIRFTIPAAVLVGALALAGCGGKKGDGIATANGSGVQPSGAAVSDNPQERMRQFAQCMRDHGIEMADPEVIEGEGGEFSVQIGPGADAAAPADQVNPREDMGKFKEANEACKQYMPTGGPMGKPDPEMEAKMREFAKCMRDNGVENFPDPQEGGGIAIQGGPGVEGGIDPNDPTFQAAQEKCGQDMPKMRAGVTTK